MPNLSLETIAERIDQSLGEVLVLMQRFEDTGMNELMADDYLSLYDIYQRLQQQQALLAAHEPEH